MVTKACDPPNPPSVSSPLVSNPIDAFIIEKLEQKNLEPSPLAKDSIIVRRLYLDLHGLLPSPKEIKDYCENKDPKKYPKLIDKLLASPRYGERWARHWLDVVRYADSNGFETNHERKTAYHYWDYVIRSLNQINLMTASFLSRSQETPAVRYCHGFSGGGTKRYRKRERSFAREAATLE